MAQQTINIGSAANDGTGDPLRTAFDKINDNFSEVYTELGGTSLSSLAFSGTAIISDVTNADINLTPNGTGKVIINSDFEVKGTTTQLDATTLQIEDNILELNRNSSGGDVDAGFFVNRGNALNSAFFYWNEGEDKFKAVLSSSDDSVTTAVTDTATATIVANIDATAAAIDTITALAEGQVTVNDSMQIRGGLTIDNNDSSASALFVEGAVSVTDGVTANTFTGALQGTISSDFGEQANISRIGSGNVKLSTNGEIKDANTNDVQINNRTTNGNIIIQPQGTGGIELNGPISNGDSSEIVFNDIVNIVDGLIVNNISSDDSAEVVVDDGFRVTGTANIATLETNNLSSGDSTAIQINDAVNISGTLGVDSIDTNTITSGDSSGVVIDAAVRINGNISAVDSVQLTVQDGLGVNGTLEAAGDVTISGQTTMTGSFLPAIHTFVATDAVTIVEHAGRTLLLGEVGGNAALTLTLPAATGTGAVYKFIVSVTNTSNYKIQVADATDTIDGIMLYLDEDGTAITGFPTVAASDTITLNGGTTGGIVGDYLELIDIATNQYHVRGVMRVAAGANPATPFTAAVS